MCGTLKKIVWYYFLIVAGVSIAVAKKKTQQSLFSALSGELRTLRLFDNC
jgi:hypothetical protein